MYALDGRAGADGGGLEVAEVDCCWLDGLRDSNRACEESGEATSGLFGVEDEDEVSVGVRSVGRKPSDTVATASSYDSWSSLSSDCLRDGSWSDFWEISADFLLKGSMATAARLASGEERWSDCHSRKRPGGSRDEAALRGRRRHLSASSPD